SGLARKLCESGAAPHQWFERRKPCGSDQPPRKKHRFREFLPARSPPTMTARPDPRGYSAKSASASDGIRRASYRERRRKVEGSLKSRPKGLTHFQLTFPLFHFSTFPLR